MRKYFNSIPKLLASHLATLFAGAGVAISALQFFGENERIHSSNLQFHYYVINDVRSALQRTDQAPAFQSYFEAEFLIGNAVWDELLDEVDQTNGRRSGRAALFLRIENAGPAVAEDIELTSYFVPSEQRKALCLSGSLPYWSDIGPYQTYPISNVREVGSEVIRRIPSLAVSQAVLIPISFDYRREDDGTGFGIVDRPVGLPCDIPESPIFSVASVSVTDRMGTRSLDVREITEILAIISPQFLYSGG
ncbi:MAG: hypothetical protein ABJH33_00185 [Rhizobiaceae bacterium]